MATRRCPECESSNYSAASASEFWKCWCCGEKISIEFQEEKEVGDVNGTVEDPSGAVED